MASEFYYITISLTVKLNDQQILFFDQVSVCLSGAVHRNMNQKYMSFFKKTLVSDGLPMLISCVVFTF